ncbi:MAG: NAD(P)H-dependent oxidoreductase [Pseudomonadota bacterium]
MANIIIIPGSVREQSVNRRLATVIGKAVTDQGGKATVINLADYPMPIYDGDAEAANGMPEGAKALAALIGEHDGVVFVTPEYNASMSPVLKNAIDWLSRDADVKVYQNRVFALAACSPGALGGIRVLSHIRDTMVSIGADVITPQVAVGGAGSAFADDDTLTNERAAGLLNGMVSTLLRRAKDNGRWPDASR